MRSLSQDSKTVTMPPRHIYNYKEGTPLVGRLLGTNAKPRSTAMAYRRFRPNRRFRNSGASELRRSSYRRRNFQRPVDRSLTVVVIVVVDGEIWAQPVFGEIGRPEEERPFGGRC